MTKRIFTKRSFEILEIPVIILNEFETKSDIKYLIPVIMPTLIAYRGWLQWLDSSEYTVLVTDQVFINSL